MILSGLGCIIYKKTNAISDQNICPAVRAGEGKVVLFMKEKIVAIVAEYKGVDTSDIKTDASFEELGLDSLDTAELLINVEDALGVTVELSSEINTIDKLVTYLESK